MTITTLAGTIIDDAQKFWEDAQPFLPVVLANLPDGKSKAILKAGIDAVAQVEAQHTQLQTETSAQRVTDVVSVVVKHVADFLPSSLAPEFALLSEVLPFISAGIAELTLTKVKVMDDTATPKDSNDI